MNKLYPLKFQPIFQERIWGGNRFNRILKKNAPDKKLGESWEISTVDNYISVVSNGFLEGNNLQELIEVYMGDLVGDKVYDKFGLEFPVLIKLIDANDILSIQVHPDDETAFKRHHSPGKTEMWYVIEAEKDAEIITGFNRDTGKEEYQEYLQSGKLGELMNFVRVRPEDSFFMPAGRVHAIGSGILLAEIQQTSDITYRIYDWDRKDANGQSRDLHIEEALDVIDFNYHEKTKIDYEKAINKTVNLASCPYFHTNLMKFNKSVDKDFSFIDSFVIYICTKGEFSLIYNEEKALQIKTGETVLVPAEIKEISLLPSGESTVLEVYIKN